MPRPRFGSGAGSKSARSCGGAQQRVQALGFGARHGASERRDLVVAAALVVGGRARGELDDERVFQQPREGAIERAGVQGDGALAAPRHLLHHGVAVQIATGQRQQDLEPDRGQRQEPLRARQVGHRCVENIRV